jgi:integrase
MPHRFTETFIKGLQPPAKGARWEWDSELTGFLLRIFAPTKIHPKGTRTFYLSYWLKSEKRYRIGSWPDWSVTAARAEAKAIRQRVDRGEDPATVRRELRDAPTMQDLWERYRTEHLPRKAPKSQRDDTKMVERHILPSLGHDRRVAEVHHADIAALHRAITGSGRPVLANRVVSCARKMFSLALKPMYLHGAGEARAWRDPVLGNPCQGIEPNPEDGRERFLSAAELTAVSDALADLADPAKGRTRGTTIHTRAPAANCIRLIMLTGCRPAEARRATWVQFDLPGFWIKPSSHTKQRKVHRAPLNLAAQELIERLRKLSPSDHKPADFVFPGPRNTSGGSTPLPRPESCWETVRRAATVMLWEGSSDPKVAKLVADLARRLGRRPTVRECEIAAASPAYIESKVTLPVGVLDARLYDLRHSFASIGAADGLSLLVIGKLLGHSRAPTTARYAHLADDPLREATERIGRTITGGVTGGATRDTASARGVAGSKPRDGAERTDETA